MSEFLTQPKADGREWDCCCARCGSSIEWDHCSACNGDGWTAPGELHEMDPLWYDEDEVAPCSQCGGQGSWGGCVSSPEWCELNPLQGREKVKRGTLEWFPLVCCSEAKTCERVSYCKFGTPHRYRPDADAGEDRCFDHQPYVMGGVLVHATMAEETG